MRTGWAGPASIVLALVLAGCQTTGLDPTDLVTGHLKSQAPDTASYNALFSPADHVDGLLESDRLADASEVYRRQQAYFDTAPGATLGVVIDDRQAAADRLEAALKADLWPEAHAAYRQLQAQPWPAARADWPAMAEAVVNARVALAVIDGHAILQQPGRRLPVVAPLRAETVLWRGRLEDAARPAFRAYPLAGGGNFFAEYPIKLGGRSFLARNQDVVVAGLDGLPAGEIAAVYATYRHHMPDGLAAQVARRHYLAVLGELGGSGVPASLAALQATKAAGMPTGDWRADSIAIFDVTPAPAGGADGAGFTVRLAAPAPLEVRQIAVQESLLLAEADEAPYLVYFEVLETTVDRRVLTRETVSSEFRSGTRREANPAYAELSAALQGAERTVDAFAGSGVPRLGSSCNSWECLGVEAALAIGTVVAEAIARRRADSIRAQLDSTPMNFEAPVYERYEFEKVTVELRKSARVRLHVLDRLHQSYGTLTATVAEALSFELAPRLHAEDRYLHRAERRFDSEDDVASFAARPLDVRMAGILTDAADLSIVEGAKPDVRMVAGVIEAAQRTRPGSAAVTDDAGAANSRQQ